MIDLRITDNGDIDIESGRKDIALTGYSTSPSDIEDAVCITQLARMSLLTEKGDFLLQPMLGNELMSLIGLPNKPDTAARGDRLIRAALQGWGITGKITIETWPENETTIAYEIHIEITPGGKELSFVIKQGLVAFGQ